MSRPSRRDFLVVAGTGVAVAGGLAAMPVSADATEPRIPSDAGPMVVQIPDPHGTELIVHRGEQTSVVRDRAIIIQLLSAVRKQS